MKYSSIEKIVDEQGYLFHFNHWNELIATEIAKLEGISLNEEHWMIIYFLRIFYSKFHVSPTVRTIIKEIKEIYGEEKGNSRYLLYLFPKGPVKQAIKIAGLPKPAICL